MKRQEPYNPFEDDSIHITSPDQKFELIDREGFNDVIKHADVVNGHQFPKRMHQYPGRFRTFLRWGIWIYILMLVVGLIYSLSEWP